MELKYKIEFFTDWHCGSGLSAGADLDSLVVKDSDGLPFIPGKTIKGLLREAVEDISQLKKETNAGWITDAFGNFGDKDDSKRGYLFFTNAELPEMEQKAIKSNNVSKFLYRGIANTAIDIDGVAKNKSLRKIEVVVPCVLYGSIKTIDTDNIGDVFIHIEEAFSHIKRLGQNRNRGLGRCLITKE